MCWVACRRFVGCAQMSLCAIIPSIANTASVVSRMAPLESYGCRVAWNLGARDWSRIGSMNSLLTYIRRSSIIFGALLSAVLLSSCLSSAGPEAPTITEQPKDKTAFITQTAKFDVGITGKPPYTFQWYRDGVVIAEATAASYTTSALTLSDAGAKFSIKVTNASGSVTSNNATLSVNTGPTLTTQPTAVSVSVGASAAFTVVGSGESLAYQWYRDGIAISGANTATYTITTTVAADDGAIFEVYVVNPGGYVASKAVTLTVNGSPALTIQPVNQTVAVGESVAFAVSATGGNLSYQWQRNGTNIAGATAKLYRIAEVTSNDHAASFSTIISNAQGSTSSAAATLSVVSAAVALPPVLPAQISLSQTPTAANSFTYVRRSNGTLASWGYNTDGQRGDGTTGAASDTIGTVTLPVGRTVKAVSAGATHALALMDNGDVMAWGLNDGGQLGLSDTTTRATPTKVTLPLPAVAIAAGRLFSLAVLNDGRVYSWGINTVGQLGDGKRDAVLAPALVSILTAVVDVAAGNTHALALRADGTVWAWGGNASGQLGEGSFKIARTPLATGLQEIARIRAGGDESLAISKRRTLYLWGENSDGQLGLGSAVSTDIGVATAVYRGAIDAASADRFTVLLGSDGLLRAAGANESGSLGDGGTTARSSFAAVSVLSTGVAVAAGGRSYAGAIQAEGSTYLWGDNASKQLGNSTLSATGVITPTAVPSFDAIP